MDELFTYSIPDDTAEIARHVLNGECPPESVDGLTGCTWAGDCTECWWRALETRKHEIEQIRRKHQCPVKL